MRKIVVLASPRTGSNLLVDSLADHPAAVSGGEWFNYHVTSEVAEARDSLGVEGCNLFKLFASNMGEPDYPLILDGALAIYLHRIDRAAQLASWKRACETGWWVAEDQGPVIPFPHDAELQIEHAHAVLPAFAELTINYEWMVSHWDVAICRILSMAGWSTVTLRQRRHRISH